MPPTTIHDRIKSSFALLRRAFDDRVALDPLNGGITNAMFVIQFEDGVKYVIRQYGNGTDLLLDRKRERVVSTQLDKSNLTSKVLVHVDGVGTIETFLKGRTLTSHDFRTPSVKKAFCTQLNKLHALRIELDRGNKDDTVWGVLTSWCSRCSDLYRESDQRSSRRVTEIVSRIRKIVSKKKGDKHTVHSPIVFCHNDLAPQNIIYDENELRFIDFEYSSYNHRGYDIGNFFCEFVGNECDWSRLPSKQERYEFYKHYLDTTDIRALDQLEKEVVFFLPLSNLLWCLWGYIQHKLSHVEFDYVSYAEARLNGYETCVHFLTNS